MGIKIQLSPRSRVSGLRSGQTGWSASQHLGWAASELSWRIVWDFLYQIKPQSLENTTIPHHHITYRDIILILIYRNKSTFHTRALLSLEEIKKIYLAQKVSLDSSDKVMVINTILEQIKLCEDFYLKRN